MEKVQVVYSVSDLQVAGSQSAGTKVSVLEVKQYDHSAPYITGEELAKRLSVSTKTISNQTYNIVGRVKVGGAVRYDWAAIEYTLKMGKNPIGGK